MARKSRKQQKAEDVASTKLTTTSAWVYARISNENDHAEGSIDNQIAICKDYINASNDLTFGGVFTDLGYSGTNFERPGYSDMIVGILNDNIKCVVVKDLSRLGRTYIEIGELLFDTFVQYKIRFISVNEHYDSFSDDASRKKLFILFKNLINYMYSLDLGKKIRSSLLSKKQRGEPLGLPPYGYCMSVNKKHFEIDCDAAKIVEMIFNMRLQGESIYCITKHLNRNHIPTPQYHRCRSSEKILERNGWSTNAVSRILHNETYTGSLIQDKYSKKDKKHKILPKEQWIIIENSHPAIISKEQFEATVRMMQESAMKYKRKSQIAASENRYTGKIFCSRCGKMAVRYERKKSDGIVFYYNCRYCVDELKYEKGIKKAPNLPLNELDDIVMESLSKCMEMLIQFENLHETLLKTALFQRNKASIVRHRKELEETISNYENSLLIAYTHHLSGLLDIREHKLVREKIESDKLCAETQLAQILEEQKKYDNDYMLNNQWYVKYREFRDHKILTKEMIQSLIGRIFLTPLSNEVRIELNYMDSFEDLRQLIHESHLD